MKNLVGRLGSFLIVIGLAILLLFVLSELANSPDFDYLFLAVLVIGAGWMLRRRGPSPQASGRFAWFRQRRTRRRDTSSKEPPTEGEEVN